MNFSYSEYAMPCGYSQSYLQLSTPRVIFVFDLCFCVLVTPLVLLEFYRKTSCVSVI